MRDKLFNFFRYGVQETHVYMFSIVCLILQFSEMHTQNDKILNPLFFFISTIFYAIVNN